MVTLAFTTLTATRDLPVTRRVPTGFPQMDAVLGGGFAAGTSALIHGDPGAGKSTLLLQIAAWVAVHAPSHPFAAAYVTAEEALLQIQERAARLSLTAPVHLLATADLSAALRLLAARPLRPLLVVFDSVQRFYTPLPTRSLPGSPTQARAVVDATTAYARHTLAAALLVCHETKTGRAAGPLALQHDVDVALALSVHPDGRRALTATKNRYGPTDRTAAFRMTSKGLLPLHLSAIT